MLGGGELANETLHTCLWVRFVSSGAPLLSLGSFQRAEKRREDRMDLSPREASQGWKHSALSLDLSLVLTSKPLSTVAGEQESMGRSAWPLRLQFPPMNETQKVHRGNSCRTRVGSVSEGLLSHFPREWRFSLSVSTFLWAEAP